MTSPPTRPRAWQAFAVYTAARALVFGVCLGGFFLAGFRSWALLLAALVLSGLLSLLLLGRLRARVSGSLAARPRRPRGRRPQGRQRRGRQDVFSRPQPSDSADDPFAAEDAPGQPIGNDPDADADDPYATDDPYIEDPPTTQPGRRLGR